MGKVNRKALIISLILTVVCALVLFNYMRNLQTPAAEKKVSSILVSTRDIKPGEMIIATDLRMAEVSADSIPEGILDNKTAIEGMYAREVILMNEPFRDRRLAKREDLSLANNLPKGFRAVSLFVNESNLLSMQMMTGDFVDVIATWTPQAKIGDPLPLTKIVMQNVLVLSLGPNRVLDEKAGSPNRGGNNPEDIPRTITLAVKPEDAELLVFVSGNANFTFALRGKGDAAIVETEGAIGTDMLSDRLKPYVAMPGESFSTPSGTTGSTSGGTTSDNTGASVP